MITSNLYFFMLSSALWIHSSCSRSSSSSDEGASSGGGLSGNMQNITGSLTSSSGTPAQMKSWVAILIEKTTGISRVAEADTNGTLKWKQVNVDSVQTALLLSPDYLLQAGMSIPTTIEKKVKQYFTITSSTLPQLVQKGAMMSFQNINGLTIADDFATDSDADGIADGLKSLGLTNGLNLASVDTDSDGVTNEQDSDMDGDGIINYLDSDQDGDGTLNIFDTDGNGNSVLDTQENLGAPYFTNGIEYFEVKYEQEESKNTVQFALKVREGVSPTAVKIRGASSLFESAQVLSPDGQTSTWDLTLADDGSSFDGVGKDGLYGKKIQLSSGKSIRPYQALFGQLIIGSDDSAITAEYPWIFPSLTLEAIAASYDASSRVVTLGGNPFGADIQTFMWSVTVKNSSDTKIYEATPISGETRTITIPSNVLQSGQTYTYEAVAQSLDKVPGLPAVAVRSPSGSISN